MNYIERLKKESNNATDYIYKKIKLKNNTLEIVNIETITSSSDINNFILKRISYLDNLDEDNLKDFLYNYLPTTSISKIKDYKDLKNKLLNGYTILIINNKDLLGIETRRDLTRGIEKSEYEKTIVGSKDSFIEHFNTNLGLIRRRIKDTNLQIKTYELGKYTKTKVGLVYLKGVSKEELIKKIDTKIKDINIDGIIDSNYLKQYLNNSNSLFPSLKLTERPDLASLSLLEGKAIIIVDNSPEVIILPTFFIDFFHSSDDYYQKSFNITFIRIIRLLAFLIAIFLPSIYISLTTHNPDSMPIDLLLSFKSQRLLVPFPAFVEAIILIIVFEILRESDVRIPSTMGTAVSILGGLVLGEACVSAGIISPIMIIVIATSAISGMLMQSVEAINSIRWYRFILIILSSIFGYFGIYLGTILILANLCETKALNDWYLYPLTPISLKEQKDGFLKLPSKSQKTRNPVLSTNKVRGR